MPEAQAPRRRGTAGERRGVKQILVGLLPAVDPEAGKEHGGSPFLLRTGMGGKNSGEWSQPAVHYVTNKA